MSISERAAELSARTSYGASIATMFAGFTLNEWAALVGIVATLITLVVNWYYRAKDSRIKAAEARAHGAKLDE